MNPVTGIFLVFLAVMAPFVSADFLAVHKHTATMSDGIVSLEATYDVSGHMSRCVAAIKSTGAVDTTELVVTYTAAGTETTSFQVVLSQKDGQFVNELQVEETVTMTVATASTPTPATVYTPVRKYGVRNYHKNVLEAPPAFTALQKEPKTEALELMGRLLVAWAANNSAPRYALEGSLLHDLNRIAFAQYVAKVATTPIRAYLPD